MTLRNLLVCLSSMLIWVLPAPAANPPTTSTSAPHAMRFDFGSGPVADGYIPIGADNHYTSTTGFGWSESSAVEVRDREQPNALLRDFAFSRIRASFRIDLPPGLYRLTFASGDMKFSNHVTQISIADDSQKLPELRTIAGEFATLSCTTQNKTDCLQINFDSPTQNWIINAMTIEPATTSQEPSITKQQFGESAQEIWNKTVQMPDPTAPYLEAFRKAQANATIQPTGLTRADYLNLIVSDVEFFKQFQNADGAIIDPYRHVEWQYSTPCFAFAAATALTFAHHEDLLEPAAKAMDWSIFTLSHHQTANNHADFFSPQIAHALPLLKPRVSADRYAKWISEIQSFDPLSAYRNGPGDGNWNVVAMDGEFYYTKLGIRPNLSYVEQCLGAQAPHFAYPWGLYTEGPMAYDHFPRLWAADMVAGGYSGQYSAQLTETLRRGAITSLFMQSPCGELPAGGRSAHHQWNEAEQCVTYEIFSARAQAANDPQLAATFKRAAHLSLQSIKRWVRPTGELQIVKNYADPSQRLGYEGYSSHSQYNLLPMAMLSIAYQNAAATEDVKELPAPSDVGGFVLDLRPTFHKIIANAVGTYIEIDTAADPDYNATGLLRIHQSGHNPQLGPSDALTAKAVSDYPTKDRTTAAVGVAWKTSIGQWKRLAEFGQDQIKDVQLSDVTQSPSKVTFTLTYTADFDGPTQIVEHYTVTLNHVEQTTTTPGYTAPLQLVWPVLQSDGAHDSKITVNDKLVSVELAGDTETFQTPEAQSVHVEDQKYPCRNGWARIAIAEFPTGCPTRLIITPK